jgi:LmbE family N-acetylglucosaminyl deacetylase
MKPDWYLKVTKIDQTDLIRFGSTLVIAPHQDDESLGCGGTIALLRKQNVSVTVVFVSDGSMSHPNSKKYPEPKLIALREEEAINACKILGIDESNVIFLRLKDSQLPMPTDDGFAKAVDLVEKILLEIKPQTIIFPWQRDPHKDHKATWQIVDEAIKISGLQIKRLEYFIWLWERAAAEELPTIKDGNLFSININPVTKTKQEAILAHVSQTTYLIDDDPEGFILSEEVLGHFSAEQELFIEQF